MKVWIDQDLCTGDGLFAEVCPPIFEMDDDGLTYVKEEFCPNRFGLDGKKSSDGRTKFKMGTGLADVPKTLEDAVIEAAEEYPGECIFIEIEKD